MENEISKNVDVEEFRQQLFGGLFTAISKEDPAMIIIGSRPDWLRNPKTGEKLYIQSMWISNELIPCPTCKEMGRHGMVSLEREYAVICCTSCRQFTWIRFEGE